MSKSNSTSAGRRAASVIPLQELDGQSIPPSRDIAYKMETSPLDDSLISPLETSPCTSSPNCTRRIPKGPPLEGRKPGGQLGNNNALKHGFYSRYFTGLEVDQLENEVQGELQDEEDLIRLYLARVAKTLKDGQMNYDKYVADLRTVSLAVGRIESIQRSRKVVYENQMSIDKVWDELKYLPVEED